MKKKWVLLSIIGFIALIGIYFVVDRKYNERRMLDAIVDFECPKEKVWVYFANQANNGDKEELLDNIGRANLSTFICFTKADEERFETKFSEEAKVEFRNYIWDKKTLLKFEDLHDIRFKYNKNSFSGSFKITTPYGFYGHFLFKGQNGRIEKVVLAHRYSDKFEHGYGAIGCDYNSTEIDTIGYDQNVSLPYSTKGTKLMAKRRIVINMGSQGVISVGMAVMSLKQLEKMIAKNIKKIRGFQVILRIDRLTDESDKEDLIKVLREFNFAYLHQMYSSPETGNVLQEIE